MTKTKEKFIDFGTDSGKVADRSLPSIYSPTAYTPAQVSSEGNDKVSAHLKGIDAILASLSSGSSILVQEEGTNLSNTPHSTLNFLGPTIIAEDAGSGVANITVSAASATFRDQIYTGDGSTSPLQSYKDFSSGQLVDAYINGKLGRLDRDYSVVPTLGYIYYVLESGFNAPLPNNAKLRFRIYSIGFSFVNEFFTADGIVTEFTLSNDIEDTSIIDVSYNGAIQREDSDWERDATNNKIVTLDSGGSPVALADDTLVTVRIWRSGEFSNQYFNGGVDSVSPNIIFYDGDRIDVYINGTLKEEGNDWNRDSVNNEIDIVDGSTVTDSNTSILVRIWN